MDSFQPAVVQFRLVQAYQLLTNEQQFLFGAFELRDSLVELSRPRPSRTAAARPSARAARM